MSTELNDCGCCEGISASTPALLENRPGLDRLSYRSGTHAQFRESLLAALSASDHVPLRALTTRDDDDFTMALLDAFAAMADVLTFYSERVAAESFLRTAIERDSVLQMARLIGYELSPGVAASTEIAFTLDETPGAPTQVTVNAGTKVQSVPGQDEKAQTYETIEEITARLEWNRLRPQLTEPPRFEMGVTKSLFFKGVATNLQPGDAILIVGDEREQNPNTYPHNERWDVRVLLTVTPDAKQDRTRVTWAEALGKAPVPPAAQNVRVHAFRQRAALFGHNAPDPRVLGFRPAQKAQLLTGNEWKNFELQNGIIDLDNAYAKIVEGSWIALKNTDGYVELYKATTISFPSRAAFGMSGKVTRIVPDTVLNLDLYGLRETIVYAQSEQLELADAPLTAAVSGGEILLNTRSDELAAGQQIAITGKTLNGQPFSLLAKISETALEAGRTKIRFAAGISQALVRESVEINANVAAATHGETVQEILGNGDAAQAHQRFTLKQSPLTFIRSTAPGGAASTLAVRVNDLLWHEAPSLYGRGPAERLFTARLAEDGSTTVQFGDGRNGARLPAGQANVRAVYRKGIGAAGLVKAGQLTTLLTRPLGLGGATNPFASEGAEDAEALDAARANAPLTVQTFDRVVSLQDYEDFARAYAGIAKALATWTWDGRTQGVFLTVAGSAGATVTDALADSLTTAITAAGDPFVPVKVESFRPATFKLAAALKIDPDYEKPPVLAAAESALRDAFSFERRAFGHPVGLSEVIAVIQATPGVIAANLTALYRTAQSAQLNARLLADLPVPGATGEIEAAELLTLHPAPIGLEEMS